MNRQPTRVESVQNSLNSFSITEAYNNSSSRSSSSNRNLSSSEDINNSSGGGQPAAPNSSNNVNSHDQIESVLALYTYVSEKPYSLPLYQGDVINVISKLPSGWWDGVNAKGQRGWFPSNFTQPLPKQPPPPATTTNDDNNNTSTIPSRPPRLSDGIVSQSNNDSIDPFTQSSTPANNMGSSTPAHLGSATPSHVGLSPAINNGIMTFEINENDEYSVGQNKNQSTIYEQQQPQQDNFYKAKQFTSIDDFDDDHHSSSINSSPPNQNTESRRGSDQSSSSFLAASNNNSNMFVQQRNKSNDSSASLPPTGDFLQSYELVDTKANDYSYSPAYWIPQVSSNGKICYVNTERKHFTGEIPFETVDESKESDMIPKTIAVTTEISEKTCTIPNLSDNQSFMEAYVYPANNNNNSTPAPHPSGRSSVDSRFSQNSKSFQLQGLESQTWSGLVNHLKDTVDAMNYAYNKWDELGLITRYNDVASTVQTINLMAGIPPGTLPSSVTSSEIAVLFRKVMANLSKLGLLCDLTSIKRRPSAASLTTSTSVADQQQQGKKSSSSSGGGNTAVAATTVLLNIEKFQEMSLSLVEDCEKFVTLYKGLLKSELQGGGENNNDGEENENGDDRIQQPEGIFPVKHYKDGTWVDINVTSNGQVTNQTPSSSNSITSNSVSGFGITTPNVMRNLTTLFSLESYDTSEPLNQDTVNKLKDFNQSLNENITNLSKILQHNDEQKWTLQTLQDRKKLVANALQKVYGILCNIVSLTETIDLSIYYGGQRRLMLRRSSRATPGTEAFSCLSLLYEFLDSKQALYVGLVDVINSKKQADSTNGDFIATLSQQLDHDKVVDVYLSYEKSVEEGIKEKISKINESMQQMTKTGIGLSEEQASFAARPITQSYIGMAVNSASSFGHRNSSVGLSSDTTGGGEPRSPVKGVVPPPRKDSIITGTENTTSAASSFKEEDIPWYLQLEHGDEMIYDRKGSPRGGSIRALVEQLTHHDKLRPDFNTAMLLTFRSFTDARELFDLLVDRFSIQPPEGLTPEEFQTWTEKKQKPVRIRVVNILKTWLENYWLEDDVEEAANNSNNTSSGSSSFLSTNSSSSSSSRNLLLDSMNKFAVQLNNRKFPGASTLLNLIDRRTKNKEPSFKRIKSNPSPKPPPILPKSLKKIHLLDVDPIEMARQLTLREFKLYVVITAQECLNRGCGNRGSKSSAASTTSSTSGTTPVNQNKIGEFIHNSNHLTNWVSFMILKHNEPKKRATTIKFFVEVSDYCREMNNFSSMTAIISGLYSSTIHRMKKTWELVPTKTRTKLDSMNQLMNSTRNFNDYRDMLNSVCPPAVPFFGVYLTDLTFTEDGNPDYLQNDSRIINFAKRMKAASTIESIRQFQQMPYNFEEINEIQSFLKQGFENAPPIEEQYNTSLNMEPRGKPGTDRVAKLLEENGIL